MAAPTLSRPKYPTPLYLNSPKDNDSPRNEHAHLEPMLSMFERASSFPLDDASRRIPPVEKSSTVDDRHAAPGGAQDTARLGSASPSPRIEIHPTTSAPTFPHSLSAPHSQERFDNSNHHHAFGAKGDNYLPPSSDRYLRNTSGTEHPGADNKYPPSFPSHSLLEQRRMSEPSIFGSSGSSHHSAYPNPGAEPSAGRYQQMQFAFNPPPLSPRSPYIHRGPASGSLRDITHPHHLSNPWKGSSSSDMHLHNLANGLQLDEPNSPLHPNFSGGAHSPTLGMPPSGYPSIGEDSYGQSPPGTGTSTASSNAPAHRNIGTANSGSSSSSKTYSFVALPGNAVKKRPRRRYDEIERLYQCSWPDCAKAYGTLNHLNAHVTMQKHGVKRNPNEFKELRKQWRKAKKEDEANRAHSVHLHHSSRRPDMIDADLYPHHHQPPSHHRHHHHHPYHHASQLHNVSVPALGPDGRFSALPIGDIRYPADELDGLPRGHGAEDAFRRGSHPDLPIRSHSRYRSTSGPGGWHSTVVSSRPANHYLASGLPSNADIALNRLGPESTLLTPLPGYEPHHSLVSSDGGLNHYGGYGAGYDDDGRPDTGHRSLYSDGRPDTGNRSLYDDGRPRTGSGSVYDDRPNTGHSLYDDRPGTGNGSERGEFRHI